MKHFGLSDIGRCRANNEDVWGALPEEGFFALADGIGGHKAGEVAAQETIDFLLSHIPTLSSSCIESQIVDIRRAIELANRHIYQMGIQNPNYHKMGTTLCCLRFFSNCIILAHVGDSRIYRFREGKLKLLTEDHSLLTEWLSKEENANKCISSFPHRHVITRSIGCRHQANPDISLDTPQTQDIFILCSDGLTDVLSLEDIEDILIRHPKLQSAAETLIETAKIKGSSDNMTVLMVQI